MSEEKTLAEYGEQISAAGYLLGIAVGYEETAELLRSKSGNAFADGDDKKAHILRDLAKLIEDLSRLKRQTFDERRPIKEAAFRKLEEADEVLGERAKK